MTDTAQTVKANFDAQIHDYFNDKPMEEPVIEFVAGEQKVTGMKKITARIIAQRAMMNSAQGEELPGEAKATNFGIGIKLGQGGDIEFTAGELENIKTRVRRMFNAGVTGQIDAIVKKALG